MSDAYRPAKYANFPIRPLTKGMMLNVPQDSVPLGSFTDIQNYYVTTKGLRRRPGLKEMLGGEATEYTPTRDLLSMWSVVGTVYTVLMDDKFIYSLTSDGMTGQYETYDTGTVSSSDTTVTGDGTSWSTSVQQQGDVLVFDPGGTPEECEISSITNSTTLVLTTAPASDYGAGTSYEIRYAFRNTNTTAVDYTFTDNLIIFVDGNRTPRSFDGSTMGEYDAGIAYVPQAITYHQDRVWFGNVLESESHYKQRIRWSSALDRTSFDADNWIDLPYGSGQIQRLVPLGQLLIVYFDNAVYVGRPTGRTDLPYQFGERLDTGDIGLPGPRGIASYRDAHWFIGQDDIYMLTASGGLEGIGSPIITEALSGIDDLTQSYVAVDTRRYRILFGLSSGSSGSEYIDTVWSYNYRLGAWSYDDVGEVYFLSNKNIDNPVAWEDVGDDPDGPDWEDAFEAGTAWGDVSGETAGYQMYVGKEITQRYVEGETTDGGTPIGTVLTTPDYDWGKPDKHKTVTRISIRIDDVLTSDVVWQVSWSHNSGSTWESLGNLTVETGEVQGYMNFIITDSVMRFKLESFSEVESYTITELVLKVRGRGEEALLITNS